MKKIILIAMLFLTTFSLYACLEVTTPSPTPTLVSLSLESNIEDAILTYNPNGDIERGTEIEISASFVTGYVFVQWYDVTYDVLLSETPITLVTVFTNLTLRAIYEAVTDETPPGDTPPGDIRINLSNDLIYTYSLGDTWIDFGCEAIVIDTEQEVPCYTNGQVDTSQIGEYEITYYAYDSEGLIISTTIKKYVLRDASLLDVDLGDYFESAEGLFGEDLLEALRMIINSNTTMQNYGEARYILQETDRDPSNASNIILLYRRTSVLGTWDLGSTWDREHVWPQSLLNVSASNSVTNIASDLHSIRPTNPQENSSRGNKYFYTSTTSQTYQPHDDAKGQVARMLFYMVTMYDHLSLVNTTPSTYQMGHLDTLLYWHHIHGVTNFERNRNAIIDDYQGNRNPFIDYPHLVELIWWNHNNILTWFN